MPIPGGLDFNIVSGLIEVTDLRADSGPLTFLLPNFERWFSTLTLGNSGRRIPRRCPLGVVVFESFYIRSVVSGPRQSALAPDKADSQRRK